METRSLKTRIAKLLAWLKNVLRRTGRIDIVGLAGQINGPSDLSRRKGFSNQNHR